MYTRVRKESTVRTSAVPPAQSCRSLEVKHFCCTIEQPSPAGWRAVVPTNNARLRQEWHSSTAQTGKHERMELCEVCTTSKMNYLSAPLRNAESGEDRSLDDFAADVGRSLLHPGPTEPTTASEPTPSAPGSLRRHAGAQILASTHSPTLAPDGRIHPPRP